MKPAGVKDHVSVMGSGEEDRNDVIVIGGGIAGMSALPGIDISRS